MDDTERTILEVTNRVLCEHGFADLPMQQTVDKSELSKAAIQYHYGSTERLFAAFLTSLYVRDLDRLDEVSKKIARDRLAELHTRQLAETADNRGIDYTSAIGETPSEVTT